MAAPSEKLAQSLSLLQELQHNGQVAIRASDMTRTHRERLLRNSFLLEVMKGWYIPTRPDERAEDSSAWYASFWSFCADYLNTRFKKEWCLSPEQSISLHSGNWTVPHQLLVRAPKGGNKPTKLLHQTSIFDVRLELPQTQSILEIEGMRVMNLSTALIACAPSHFKTHPIEIRSALSMITNASELLRKLLEGNHSTVAGRLAGAFRNIGRDKIADKLIATMKNGGHTITECDPFEEKAPSF